MAAKRTMAKKRRIEAHVDEDIGARIDRLAEVYRTKQVPGANIKASVALRAVVIVGIEAEEKRLGLPPLSEPASSDSEPAPLRRTSSKRTTRPRLRARSRGKR
jgi:hypothetical protein